MNGLVARRGERIKELKDEFARFGSLIHTPVDASAVVDLQTRRGAKRYRLSVLARRKQEAVDDRTRIETEIHGYRKALSLFEGSSPGRGVGRSANRLLGRLDVRIGESDERSLEIDELESEIQRVEAELRAAEKRLINELQACVAEASRRHAVHTASVRTRAHAEGATLTDDAESMWSPTPVLAYRVWGLRRDGLYGAWTRWSESTNTATCTSGSRVPHTDGRCNDVAFGCGIYAAKDMGPLLRSVGVTKDQNFAAGLVALEGKVVEHERGYRAERATAVSLIIVHEGVMSIVEDPVNVRDTFVDPWERGTETLALPTMTSNDHMMRTIVDQLRKREGRHNTWT